MFNRRIQTVGTIGEFMRREPIEIIKFNKKAAAFGVKASLTTIAGATAVNIAQIHTNTAYAASVGDYVKDTAKQKIIEAFHPLVDMVQALSYPVALVMLTGGALIFMIGQKDKGISLIQNAAIGYILVQLMPLMMELLVGIGKSVGFVAPYMFA